MKQSENQQFIIEKTFENQYFNTTLVFDRQGAFVGKYRKNHVFSHCGSEEAKYINSGDEVCIIDIEGIKVGIAICYDIRFPELFRSYSNTPYPPELLINMSAWPLSRKEQYQAMATSRAIENQCYFLALSQTGNIKGNINNSGNSVLIDPMGNVVEKLDEKVDYIFAKINTEIVDNTRKTFPNLKNRKVHSFGFVPEFFGGVSVV